jgi:hypothetical protein
MANVLGANSDFSLYDSLCLLKQANSVNPIFENTLKGNTNNGYCRGFIYELFEALFKPEFEEWAIYIESGVDVTQKMKRIEERFYELPLKTFRPDIDAQKIRLPETFRRLANAALKLSAF